MGVSSISRAAKAPPTVECSPGGGGPVMLAAGGVSAGGEATRKVPVSSRGGVAGAWEDCSSRISVTRSQIFSSAVSKRSSRTLNSPREGDEGPGGEAGGAGIFSKASNRLLRSE